MARPCHALSALPPSTTRENPQEAASIFVEHQVSNLEFTGEKIVGASLGDEAAYDGPFYQLRSPVVRASEIDVPVVIEGGWWDLFQRGEPLLWESLRNSPDRVLFMSPHYHVTSGQRWKDPNSRMNGSLTGSGEQERHPARAQGQPLSDQRHALGNVQALPAAAHQI